ncbi:MAG: hypothetical protein IKF17_01215 [Clostridia bacterium]|nr:hypothetical protein [Clostridia bacterium]
MASCLGLYIENNLIKFAKVSKERDNLKVEAFGLRFYDDLGQAIDQIVEETYSYKTPVSINLSDEMYTYFNVFSLLGKNYLPKVVQTEFESYCTEKGYNPNVFETRYALVDDLNDKEKLKVINISANKLELNRRTSQLDSYKLTTITPISMAITNIADLPEKENAIIVNMEENTIITTVIDQKIYDIDILDEGSTDVLSKINARENSYAQAYEACKNTTIYTAEGKDLETEQNYIDDVLPTLNQIVSRVRETIDNSLTNIKKVYLTGTLTCVNNIDLYFQEYLPDADCRILRPSFISTEGNEINIREYIEVNSAIALGLQGLEIGVTGMNFKKKSFSDLLKMDIGGGSKAKTPKAKKTLNLDFSDWLKPDFREAFTAVEINLLRVAIGLIILLIVYSGLSIFLTNQMHKKENEVNDQIAQTQEQINLAKDDKGKIDTKTNEYKEMTKALQELNDRVSDINQSRNIIPNLLNQIMFVIPENVQITSIENTTGKHIVIVAQSDKYEPLGYFKAKLNSDRILYDVVSNSGVSDGSVIKVTIEGDLQ